VRPCGQRACAEAGTGTCFVSVVVVVLVLVVVGGVVVVLFDISIDLLD